MFWFLLNGILALKKRIRTLFLGTLLSLKKGFIRFFKVLLRKKMITILPEKNIIQI